MKPASKSIKSINILAISDEELPNIYSSNIQKRFTNVDLVLSCGDLGYYYLEFIISMLNKPLYFVQGNHAPAEEYSDDFSRNVPWGGINVHRKTIYNRELDLIIAGIEGCLNYNDGPHQYSSFEMWIFILSLIPKLLANKLKYGRYLDVFITHAAPKGIQEDEDRAHRGVQAFSWFDKTFKPIFHLHGHVRQLIRDQAIEKRLGITTVLNVIGYKEIEFKKS